MAQAAYGSTHSLHSARLYEHAGQVLSAGMTCSAGATRRIQYKMPSHDMQARWDAQQAVGLLLTQLKVRGCLCCTAADCAELGTCVKDTALEMFAFRTAFFFRIVANLATFGNPS